MTTSSINIGLKKKDRKPHRNVKRHNLRVGKQSNKNIDESLSKYNEHVQIYDREKIIEEHYKKDFEYANRKQRRYRTLKEYQGGKNETTGVFEVGDKDTHKKMMDIMVKAGAKKTDIFDSFKQANKAYFSTFNERHNNALRVSDIYIHVDESTPHTHADLFYCGHTKSGKASDIPNRAFEEVIPEIKGDGKMDKINRIKAWRDREDKLYFKHVTGSYRKLIKEKGLKVDEEEIDELFTFTRKDPDEDKKGRTQEKMILDNQVEDLQKQLQEIQVQITNNKKLSEKAKKEREQEEKRKKEVQQQRIKEQEKTNKIIEQREQAKRDLEDIVKAMREKEQEDRKMDEKMREKEQEMKILEYELFELSQAVGVSWSANNIVGKVKKHAEQAFGKSYSYGKSKDNELEF